MHHPKFLRGFAELLVPKRTLILAHPTDPTASGTTPTHRKSRNYERVKPHGQHLQANMPPHPDPQACDSSQVTRIERVYIRSGLHRRVTTLWTSVPSIKGLGQQLGLGLGQQLIHLMPHGKCKNQQMGGVEQEPQIP